MLRFSQDEWQGFLHGIGGPAPANPNGPVPPTSDNQMHNEAPRRPSAMRGTPARLLPLPRAAIVCWT